MFSHPNQRLSAIRNRFLRSSDEQIEFEVRAANNLYAKEARQEILNEEGFDRFMSYELPSTCLISSLVPIISYCACPTNTIAYKISAFATQFSVGLAFKCHRDLTSKKKLGNDESLIPNPVESQNSAVTSATTPTILNSMTSQEFEDQRDLASESQSEIQPVQTESQSEIQPVQTESQSEIQPVQTESQSEIQPVQTESQSEIQATDNQEIIHDRLHTVKGLFKKIFSDDDCNRISCSTLSSYLVSLLTSQTCPNGGNGGFILFTTFHAASTLVCNPFCKEQQLYNKMKSRYAEKGGTGQFLHALESKPNQINSMNQDPMRGVEVTGDVGLGQPTRASDGVSPDAVERTVDSGSRPPVELSNVCNFRPVSFEPPVVMSHANITG